MVSANIRDILTAFSPSLDFLAISSGDGRIKIWDTLKGQIQTEFADITGAEETDCYIKTEKGHLSVDYTCMIWLAADGKKKRKLVSSLLVLGTGSGDILALDVSAGKLKWRVNDCHPGGVSAISSSKLGQFIFTAGADGMVCEIDFLTGNLLRKFKASTKGVSSLSISPDGNMVATAAGQLKIFNCSDHKKIQKFSGHPGAVRCMNFSEDGNFILSSSAGERYIAVWKVGSGKKQSASCVLAMEHPAVFLECRNNISGETDNEGLSVLAISEIGVCYLWTGQNIQELSTATPTKISLSKEDSLPKKQSMVSTIFAAKLQSIASSESRHIFVAYGLLVKPLFQRLLVHAGTDIVLGSAHDGVLLPSQPISKPKKGKHKENKVLALDRANAEGALLPVPRLIETAEGRKTDKGHVVDADKVMAGIIKSRTPAKPIEGKGVGGKPISMEDQLRSLGLLHEKDLTAKSRISSEMLRGIDLEANLSHRKMRTAVLSMEPSEAYKLLDALVTMWKSRSCSASAVLPWIKCILVSHSHHVVSQEESKILDFLSMTMQHRSAAFQPLLQLVGRLQLVIAQVDKAAIPNEDPVNKNEIDEINDEDEEDVDDVYHGHEEDESELSSDNDDE